MEQTAPKKRGRPVRNPEGKMKGNRTLQIRMDPPDLKAIEDLGGATWARPILLAALRELQGQCSQVVTPPTGRHRQALLWTRGIEQ